MEEEDPGEFGRGTQDVLRDFLGDGEGSGVGLLLTLVTYHYFVCSHLFTHVLLSRPSPRRPPASCQRRSFAGSCARGGK